MFVAQVKNDLIILGSEPVGITSEFREKLQILI